MRIFDIFRYIFRCIYSETVETAGNNMENMEKSDITIINSTESLREPDMVMVKSTESIPQKDWVCLGCKVKSTTLSKTNYYLYCYCELKHIVCIKCWNGKQDKQYWANKFGKDHNFKERKVDPYAGEPVII